MDNMMEALILAGGLNKGKLAECSSERWEAMIDLAGRPMATYVVKGMLDSGRISRVVISGPPDLQVALADFGDRVLIAPPGANLIDSLMNALELTKGEKVLIGSADIPLIDGEAIRDFIERCERDEADVHYALVFKEDYDKCYPGGKRTYINLKDGVLTGANVFMASRKTLLARKQVITDMYDRRKNPLAMATALHIGPLMITKFLMGKLSVAEVQNIARRSFGLEGRGVRTPYASVAMDVDKPSDLDLAKQNVKW